MHQNKVRLHPNTPEIQIRLNFPVGPKSFLFEMKMKKVIMLTLSLLNYLTLTDVYTIPSQNPMEQNGVLLLYI